MIIVRLVKLLVASSLLDSGSSRSNPPSGTRQPPLQKATMDTLSRPAETSGGDMTPQLHQLLGNSVELLVVLHQLCQPLLLLCVVLCELPGLGDMDLEFVGRFR